MQVHSTSFTEQELVVLFSGHVSISKSRPLWQADPTGWMWLALGPGHRLNNDRQWLCWFGPGR